MRGDASVKIIFQQMSSLEKVRRDVQQTFASCHSRKALAGERICYQLYIHADDQVFA